LIPRLGVFQLKKKKSAKRESERERHRCLAREGTQGRYARRFGEGALFFISS